MKNTNVMPSMTLDLMSRPNQTAKIGARITRGMEFNAVIYGFSSFAAKSDNASHRPKTRPSAVPMRKARIVSISVTPR